MKNIYKIIVITIVFLTLNACQDVVEVDLETAHERLVIEALLKWENGTSGSDQTIQLTKTASYYTNDIIYATGASVKVINLDNLAEFTFTETSNGIYETTTFVPVLNADYTLEIEYNGEHYVATTKLLPTPTIDTIDQSTDNGFSTIDPEVNVYFQDYANQSDYYRTYFSQNRAGDEVDWEYSNYDARYEDGNLLHDFYESDDILVDDIFTIEIYSISEQFNVFLNLLEQQAGESHGPFSSPPVNVKGNCINTTTETNYPYGYFGVFEMHQASYTFQ